MTGFGVQPAALDKFASLLDQPNAPALASKYLTDASDYVEKYIKLEGGSGGWIFGRVVSTMDDFADTVTTANTAICDTLEECASGLTASAQDYRKQDYASAKHLDDTYHSGSVTALSDYVDTEDPAVDPSSKLTPPGTDGAIPEPVETMLNSVGYFSESELTLQILKLCGFDAEQWIKNHFAGDYEALARCMNAVHNLEHFNEAAATAIAEAANTMFASWQGHAAQAAKSYFDQLANAIADYGNMISNAYSKLQAVCAGIQQASESLALLVGAALDKAAEVAVSLGADAGLQEIPGIDVIADIWTGTRVVEVIKKIKEVTDKWNLVQAGLQGASGLITGLIGTFSGYDVSVKLPQMGYYNASQGGSPNTGDNGNGGEHGPR
ncbi:MAG: hypothetical protein J2P17_14085 [Mycobacterium sp.]|nr:hypothetical protein [Mycobacterium sp.]